MPTSTRFAALSLCAALAAGPLAAQGFEGSVTYKMTSEKGKVTEMVMSMKGPKMRTDLEAEGHSMTMLIDGPSQTMKMLMTDQKMVMSMDLKGMQERKRPKKRTPPKITALGTGETIAGRSCENYLVETEDSKEEFCNSKGLGHFLSPHNPMGGGPSNGLTDLDDEIYRSYFKDGFFPLRVTEIKGDKRRIVMEATQVERKSFDAAYFEVPAGYTEMKMPGMGSRP